MRRLRVPLLTVLIPLLWGCKEKPVRFHAVKFSTAAASDEGAYVVTFSKPGNYALEAYVVSGGKATLAWSGLASLTRDGTPPFVGITTYAIHPDENHPGSKLHILTSTHDQHILSLPEGRPWFSLAGGGASISGKTAVYFCPIYPQEFSGNYNLYSNLWPRLEDYVAKSAMSSVSYVVVLCEEAAEP